MGDGLTTQPIRKFRVGQRDERLGDLSRLNVVVADDQPLEQRLVPLAAQMPRCGQVGPLAIGQEVERLAERVLDVCESGLRDFDVALGLSGLGREPVLLGAQQVDGDGPGVVGVQELLALLAQLCVCHEGLEESLEEDRLKWAPVLIGHDIQDKENKLAV